VIAVAAKILNVIEFIHCTASNRELHTGAWTGTKQIPVRNHEAKRDLEQQTDTELQMTFLPKTAEARQELLTLLIAIPASLLGTGFLFFLMDTGSRFHGV
jgi:hypothetical protein